MLSSTVQKEVAMSPFAIFNESNDSAQMNVRTTISGELLRLMIDQDPTGKDPDAMWATIYIDKRQAQFLTTMLHQFVNGV